jgi:hypothetical protein
MDGSLCDLHGSVGDQEPSSALSTRNCNFGFESHLLLKQFSADGVQGAKGPSGRNDLIYFSARYLAHVLALSTTLFVVHRGGSVAMFGGCACTGGWSP